MVQVFILLCPPPARQIFLSLTFYMLCHFFFFLISGSSSSCSTSHCGSWTCWSGSSPVWFCTSYTLCCALSAGTTPCLWALFSAATTMSFLNCSETALCWAKPTLTLCPPTVWGSSHSKGSSQWDLTYELWTWRGEMGGGLVKTGGLFCAHTWRLRDRLWTHNRFLIRFYF